MALAQLKMSAAALTGMSEICSGDMYVGVPMMPLLVTVNESKARAMPKSITRGPSGPSSTLLGLKSRCTTPAA